MNNPRKFPDLVLGEIKPARPLEPGATDKLRELFARGMAQNPPTVVCDASAGPTFEERQALIYDKVDLPPRVHLVIGDTHLDGRLDEIHRQLGREKEMVLLGIGHSRRIQHQVALAAALAGITMLANFEMPKASVMSGGDYDGNSMLNPGTIRNRDPKYKPRPVTNYAGRKAKRWNG